MNIYDYGQWYRFNFFGYGSSDNFTGKCIYTRDRNIHKDDRLRKLMRSKGYSYYYCRPRVKGVWDWVEGFGSDTAGPI